jgi:hypothetical protein
MSVPLANNERKWQIVAELVLGVPRLAACYRLFSQVRATQDDAGARSTTADVRLLPPDALSGGSNAGIYRPLPKACRSLVAIRVFVRS